MSYIKFIFIYFLFFYIYQKGPFVHLSTMVGAYLSKLGTQTQANKKVK